MIQSGTAIPEGDHRHAEPDIEILSTVSESRFEEAWYSEAHEVNFWMQWRFSVFVAELRALGIALESPLKILDIGCGTGVLRRQVEGATDWVVDGADVDVGVLRYCLPGRGRTLCYDVQDEHRDCVERYDGVLLFDVLEHVPAPRAFLDSVVRHLRPGGWLFLNVPALQSFASAYDEAVGHLRRYNRLSLLTELDALPVRVEDLSYWGLAMVPLLAARRFVVGQHLKSSEDKEAIIRRGWRPPSGLVETVLKCVMRVETTLCPRTFFGTSLMCACVKVGDGA